MDTLNIYSPVNGPNFGDAVNVRFWKEMANKSVRFTKEGPHYITTGSILCRAKSNSIIFGTGFISVKGDLGGEQFSEYKSHNKKYVIPKEVIAVRGPLSRQKMLQFGVECPANYGDPLILMPCIYDKRNTVSDRTVGIIPHYVDQNSPHFKLLINNLKTKGYKVKLIDIRVGHNYEKLIDEINKCEYIISSSLQGVMMGIVYNKKTIFIEFSNNVIGRGFKFQDFFLSINTTYKNKNIYNHEVLKNIIKVDYQYLLGIGLKLISLIPFIDAARKKVLSNKYEKFYDFQ